MGQHDHKITNNTTCTTGNRKGVSNVLVIAGFIVLITLVIGGLIYFSQHFSCVSDGGTDNMLCTGLS